MTKLNFFIFNPRNPSETLGAIPWSLGAATPPLITNPAIRYICWQFTNNNVLTDCWNMTERERDRARKKDNILANPVLLFTVAICAVWNALHMAVVLYSHCCNTTLVSDTFKYLDINTQTLKFNNTPFHNVKFMKLKKYFYLQVNEIFNKPNNQIYCQRSYLASPGVE